MSIKAFLWCYAFKIYRSSDTNCAIVRRRMETLHRGDQQRDFTIVYQLEEWNQHPTGNDVQHTIVRKLQSVLLAGCQL